MSERDAGVTEARPPDGAPCEPRGDADPSAALDLITTAAQLLFIHGETTQRTGVAVAALGKALGRSASLLARWGELTLCLDRPPFICVVAADPVAVDMGRVAATGHIVAALAEGRLDPESARTAFAAVAAMPGPSTARFVLLVAAGAAALGVIFGTADPLTLSIIALSAAAGACLRKWLATQSRNPFIQPFCAALLAGAVASLAAGLHLAVAQRLVAVCPCMVLVPGPHLLNGTIDLARARIALGAARIGFASLIVLMICTGLLIGLTPGGLAVLEAPAAASAPLGYDVLAAGVAVAAYGTFFNMPWRTLPVPIAIGMLAHAARWELLERGASVQAGAFIACCLVGLIVTPVADRLRMPFAAFAFSSVVSLVPGVFLFQAAAGLLELIDRGGTADLILGVAKDATTAFAIMFLMTLGLIVPKMLVERFR